MADPYKDVADQVLALGNAHAVTVLELADTHAEIAALNASATADAEQIALLEAKEAAYLAAIAELEAEIERLGGGNLRSSPPWSPRRCRCRTGRSPAPPAAAVPTPSAR